MKTVLSVSILAILLVLGRPVAILGQPGLQPERIVMNLTENPSTSVAVTWRTGTAVQEGFCELQPASATRINAADSGQFRARTTPVRYFSGAEQLPVEVNQHACILTGLTPGGKYLYRVGNGEHWSEWFQFQLPALDGGFSFIYFGDPQSDLRSQWSRVVREAYRKSPDCGFMLYAGDIINRAGRDDEYQQLFDAGGFIFPMVPQVMTPGNHDYRDGKIDPHWNLQFTFPQNGPAGLKGSCYFIDYQNLRLISIDSAAGDELEDENGYEMTAQKNWLDSVLRTNTKEWVIVTTHLPFYSTKDSRDNANLRRNFQPILEKYKVDLVLTGHDHAYGRGSVSDNPVVKPSIVYVVSVSGPKIYEAGSKNWMQKKGSNIQLFQEISIRGDVLKYNAYTVDGKLFDSFEIRNNQRGGKKFVD